MATLEEKLIAIAGRFGMAPIIEHYPDPEWDEYHSYRTDGLRISYGRVLGFGLEPIMGRTEAFAHDEQVYLHCYNEADPLGHEPLIYKPGAWELAVDLIYTEVGQEAFEGFDGQEL